MSKGKMSAVILCGGKSKRMGTDKARLMIDGMPAAERLVGSLQAETDLITDVWLSIGSEESYPEIRAKKVSDRFENAGPMAGLEAALAVCHEDLLFVTAVDYPLADGALARELYEKMDPAADAVLVLDEAGRVQPYLGIYRRRVRALLTDRLADGGKGSGRIKDLFRDLNILYVQADELENGTMKTVNCNTPQEFYTLMSHHHAGTSEDEEPAVKKPALLSVTGWSGSGKTTWLERLLPHLTAKGLKVAAVKHDAHAFMIDKEGKDTWRMAQAGAAVTVIVSADQAAVMEYRPAALDVILSGIRDVDLIILEGGSSLDLPRILVYREALGKGMRVPPQTCMAVISDDEIGENHVRQFSFDHLAEAADYITQYFHIV